MVQMLWTFTKGKQGWVETNTKPGRRDMYLKAQDKAKLTNKKRDDSRPHILVGAHKHTPTGKTSHSKLQDTNNIGSK